MLQAKLVMVEASKIGRRPKRDARGDHTIGKTPRKRI